MPEPTSLKQAIQGMTQSGIEVIRGKVVSAAPLKVQALNDEKLQISANILCVPKHLTNYSVSASLALSPAIDGVSNVQAAMTVNDGLKAGEVVYILSYNHGKKYYILDREA